MVSKIEIEEREREKGVGGNAGGMQGGMQGRIRLN